MHLLEVGFSRGQHVGPSFLLPLFGSRESVSQVRFPTELSCQSSFIFEAGYEVVQAECSFFCSSGFRVVLWPQSSQSWNDGMHCLTRWMLDFTFIPMLHYLSEVYIFLPSHSLVVPPSSFLLFLTRPRHLRLHCGPMSVSSKTIKLVTDREMIDSFSSVLWITT